MSRTQSYPLDLAAVPQLDVTATALRLDVEACAPGEAPRMEVDARLPKDGPLPVEVRRDGDVTRLVVRQGWEEFPFLDEAIRGLTLFVPAQVRLVLRCDVGRVSVKGLQGCDLTVATTAGAVELEDVRGRITLAVDSGSVKGERLSGTFQVRSQAGSVRLSIDALDAGQHLVRTSLGSVKVALATGLAVRLDTATTLGSVRCSYPSTPDAPAVLRLEADLGSVRVRDGGQAEDTRHGDWPDWRRLWQQVQDVASAPSTAHAGATVATHPAAARAADPEALRKVLELVETGKLSAADAERLIRAMTP